MAELILDGVRKGYGSRCVLRDATAVLRPGVHLIEGDNGVGKSTLLSIMSGTLAPTAGRVLLDGRDMFAKRPQRRRQLAFVPAEPTFFEGVTVSSALQLYLSLQGVRCVADPLDVADPFGLHQVSEFRFGDLSLGWRKRVLLHMALVTVAEFIVLDEPTVGLDQDAVRVLVELIRTQSVDRLIVLTCHEPSVLARAEPRRHQLESQPGGSILRS
ncbi:ABC transporter ATP-binding protein [Luteibacter sp. UNCMF366Tsu5.1]|uniref:ABC transporter ATP-binding protein n=1 Tax=Luteibacter sp. UNCMF366Tsu5.1 TaxID=1502758 RepID=UPI000908C82B|nr:ABC transporter ATP-binding protein [Luteibacter sp. UNCMF366Tsu5.1]SFW33179.1 ABC-2 type transport system ATP-binding protein [Luteibacter sp. UNCMF366Tsu5.1]